MARPEFPTPYTPLSSNMISSIRQAQQVYDEDPERWERQERAREEERAQEQERQFEEEANAFAQCQQQDREERWRQNYEEDDLPF